jgi:hypothetical protein
VKQVKELSREDWIILRLIRAALKAYPPRLSYDPEFHRATNDLLKRCGVRAVHDAIDQLNAKGK